MSGFNLKGFVEDVLKDDSKLKSTEIAKFLHAKGHTEITWQMIASIRGKLGL